jgi:hypothetical protein
MEAMKRYNVRVAREGGQWLGEAVGVPGAHTFAGNLPSLEAAMREVIALVEDLPPGAEDGLDVEWDLSAVSPEAAAAADLGQRRRRQDAERQDLAEATRAAAAQLADAGWSVRDAGAALGVSPARVSQLLRSPKQPVGR